MILAEMTSWGLGGVIGAALVSAVVLVAKVVPWKKNNNSTSSFDRIHTRIDAERDRVTDQFVAKETCAARHEALQSSVDEVKLDVKRLLRGEREDG